MKKAPKTEVMVPVKEFNAALWRRFKTGKIRNVYPKVKYDHIVKKIKTMAVNPPINSPGEYYLLRKFVVAKIGDVERLACKSDINAIRKTRDLESKKIKFYVALEEIHQFIDDAHKSTNHGGRDKIVRILQQNGVMNVARDTVELFLSFCKICRPKQNQTPTRRALTRNNTQNTSTDNSENVADTASVENPPDITEPTGSLMNGIAIKTEVDPESSNHHVFQPPEVVFRRGHVAILDLTASPDGDYRFILLYLDYSTHFCILRPVKCKCTYEVASHLLDVFTFVGPPQILHSLYDSPFLSTVINEIKQSWPDCVIVFSRDNANAETARQCISDVEKLLRNWMLENNSHRWSFGLRFVQLKKNTKLLDGISKTPYERFFGKPLQSLPSCVDIASLRSAQKEEDLVNILKKQKETYVESYERLQVSLDPDVCTLVQNSVPQKSFVVDTELSQDELVVDTSIVKVEPLDSDEG